MIAGLEMMLSSSSLIPRRGEQGVTIGRAIEALLEAKRAANLRPSTISGLRQYLRQFSRGRESIPLSAFTVEVVEDWFLNRRETPSTQASNAGRLASLFSYAVRRQWIRDNPCRFLEKVRIERKPPFILAPWQAAWILDYARRRKPQQLAFWTLSLLVGMRPHEVLQMSWKAISLEDGTVTVDAATTKVRRRRIIYPEPSALAWLKLAKEHNALLPLSSMTKRRFHRQAAKLLRLESWPHDCSRHTAASYLLALHKDSGRVARTLGNSARILEGHYIELVPARDCAAYWSFMPDSPRPEKPVEVPVEPDPVVLPPLEAVIDPSLPRFSRVEAALKTEGQIRALAKQRQRDGSYFGGVQRKRMVGERIDTIREIGRLAGCSRQTVQFCRQILRLADPDVLDALRKGRRSIAGVYKQIAA